MDEILKKIYEIKQSKKSSKVGKKRLLRRALKLSEESGEVAQAVFSITSDRNPKNKTYADVREELVDTVIVALELLLSEFPDEELDGDESYDYIKERSLSEFNRKIQKWTDKEEKEEDDDQ